MRSISKLGLAALAATMLVVALSGPASANRLSLSEQETLITWDDLDFAGGIIQCDVSLRVTFHSRTFEKVPGRLVGHITAGDVGACNAGNSASILQSSLPWHVQYDSFIGRLPSITGIRLRLINAAFLINLGGAIGCLYRSTAANPAFGIANRNAAGLITGLSADEGPSIPIAIELTLFCPSTGRFSGTGGLSRPITVTLI